MKYVGMVRRLDNLGRLVLPIELRRIFGIEKHDGLEIFTDNGRIILRKYEPDCTFCGNTDEVTNFKNRNICVSCLSEMSQGVTVSKA